MPISTLTNVSSRYGAPMGRPGIRPVDFKAPVTFYLRRVYLNGGGYDSGGAYWGFGQPLYRAESAEEVEVTYGPPTQIERYLRAYDREDAKAQLLREYPNAKFFN